MITDQYTIDTVINEINQELNDKCYAEEIVNKQYADKHYWQTRMLGGYKTNNNSSSLYYTNVDASDSRWTDSDSSPTAVDVSMGTKTPFFVCVQFTSFSKQMITADN